MKKISLIFAVLMLVSILFTSCIKDDTVSGNTDDINRDVVADSSLDEPKKNPDNSADATKNSVADVAEEEELNLFEMTREEQIEFLKPYIYALEEDIIYLVEKNGDSYVALYEYGSGWGYNAEIKHLVKGSITGFASKNEARIIEIGDWKLVTYDNGEYEVSGELLNTKGENVGDKPWDIPDAVRVLEVTDDRFESIDDIKAYYDDYLSPDFNMYNRVESNYIEFDGKLYEVRGEGGYFSVDECLDFDNMEIIVTDNHSCIAKIRYTTWNGEVYRDNMYRFDIRHGKFLLTESEKGEWVSLY